MTEDERARPKRRNIFFLAEVIYGSDAFLTEHTHAFSVPMNKYRVNHEPFMVALRAFSWEIVVQGVLSLQPRSDNGTSIC